jgi:choline dehydrogenase-like flavoprotein
MGLNPDTSVVDAFGFVHEVPNLGVLGGSVMGTAGARNPTQTLQALAWRTASQLVLEWDTRTG